MIKVIFLDLKDGETRTVSYNREELKSDSMSMIYFQEEVHNMFIHFMDKLREEKGGKDKCQKP